MNAPFPAHHAVIAALREENDILRETVRQLREDLAPRMAFPKAWKLSPHQSAVLSCIMAASPHVATRGRILSALYGDREAPDCADKLLNVMVHEIRKRLRAAGAEAGIRNIFGRGYVMTAATRERLLDVPEEPEAPDPLWWAEAHRLRAEGVSYRKIAAACRKSVRDVYRVLSEASRSTPSSADRGRA